MNKSCIPIKGDSNREINKVKEQFSFTLLTQKVAESPLVYTKELSNGK
jgi:hypothetical protein